MTRRAKAWRYSRDAFRRETADGFTVAIVERDERNENLWCWGVGSTTDRKAYRSEFSCMRKADTHLESIGYELELGGELREVLHD